MINDLLWGEICLFFFYIYGVIFLPSMFRSSILLLKVALQILRRKFYKNTKKIVLVLPNLLIFIHKTPVVENHPTTREIRDLPRPRSTPTGNTVYFYMRSSLIYILEIHRRSFKYSIV